MRTSDVAKDGTLSEVYKEIVMEPYTLVKHDPYEHAFRAESNSTILAFACGLRGGNFKKRCLQNNQKYV